MALPENIANSLIPGQVTALTTLSKECSEVTTTIEVVDKPPAALEAPGQFHIVVGQEIMIVTGGQTTTKWTVSRAQEGTKAEIHGTNTPVYNFLTAETFKNIISERPTGIFHETIGNGSSTSFKIKHELGTNYIVVSIYETAEPHAMVDATIEVTNENEITVQFSSAPTANQYVVSVISGMGKEGKEGKSGTSLLTYPELIAKDSPINGWDLQDEAGVSSLKATYGTTSMSVTGLTSGVTTTPLYPGSKAIHFDGGAHSGAVAATSELTTYAAMTAECWCYFPEGASLGGWVMGFGENSKSGFMVQIVGETLTILYSGVAFVSTVSEMTRRWHHICCLTSQASQNLAQVFVDGTRWGANHSIPAWKNTENYITIGCLRSEGAVSGETTSTILFAHAYIYNKRLSDAAIRARSNLVNLLH